MKFAHAFLLMPLLSSTAAVGLTFDVLNAPPAQSTSSTCQSYSMAVGVSLLSLSPFLIDSEATMKESETRIRAVLKTTCPSCTEFNRDHWKMALEAYSSNKLTLGSKAFSNVPLLYEYLYQNAVITKKTPLDPALQVSISKPSTGFFLSVTELDGKIYPSGHVVTVLGVDAPKTSDPSYRPALLILNSGNKNVPDQPVSDTQCIAWPDNGKPKYVGSLTWISNYTIKHNRLDWVIKK
ncbi:hypothetical protein [Pseudomonas sp. JV241A]|uniref:hypothetical protein n=1 Tax=Pseudomonas sp. JV241A TaxID=2078785 RepID=UPI00100D72DB|nr:hypothetical protein [Pseudomonas sp. JV241A]SPO69490.1 exported protein of unknown function [Pseudomonas sp. JV241A]